MGKETERDRNVALVRRFNRFYTQAIGTLQKGIVGSEYSLTEGRVLYELSQREQPRATQLASSLGLDAGYLSRILRRFERKSLVRRTQSRIDGRENLLQLTAKGKKELGQLNLRTNQLIGALLEALSMEQRSRLVGAMLTIQDLLGR